MKELEDQFKLFTLPYASGGGPDAVEGGNRIIDELMRRRSRRSSRLGKTSASRNKRRM